MDQADSERTSGSSKLFTTAKWALLVAVGIVCLLLLMPKENRKEAVTSIRLLAGDKAQMCLEHQKPSLHAPETAVVISSRMRDDSIVEVDIQSRNKFGELGMMKAACYISGGKVHAELTESVQSNDRADERIAKLKTENEATALQIARLREDGNVQCANAEIDARRRGAVKEAQRLQKTCQHQSPCMTQRLELARSGNFGAAQKMDCQKP